MGAITRSLDRLDPERSTVCLCHHGARSMQVGLYLEQQGFRDVVNLTGGIHAWSEQVDPAVRTY
jgi:rhodanese-related sulfurtransferase